MKIQRNCFVTCKVVDLDQKLVNFEMIKKNHKQNFSFHTKVTFCPERPIERGIACFYLIESCKLAHVPYSIFFGETKWTELGKDKLNLMQRGWRQTEIWRWLLRGLQWRMGQMLSCTTSSMQSWLVQTSEMLLFHSTRNILRNVTLWLIINFEGMLCRSYRRWSGGSLAAGPTTTLCFWWE